MPTPLSYLHPKPAVGQVNEIGGFQVGKWKKKPTRTIFPSPTPHPNRRWRGTCATIDTCDWKAFDSVMGFVWAVPAFESGPYLPAWGSGPLFAHYKAHRHRQYFPSC